MPKLHEAVELFLGNARELGLLLKSLLPGEPSLVIRHYPKL
jgi:hypothetical protein